MTIKTPDEEQNTNSYDPNLITNNLFSMQPVVSGDEEVKISKNKISQKAKDLFDNKVTFTIITITLLVFAILLIIPKIGVRRGIAGIGEPVQKEATGYVEKEIDGYEVSIYFQYSYEIEALVVHTHNYYGFSFPDKLAPRDVALAWGKVAEYNGKINFHWRQSGRWYYWRVKSYDELAPIGDENDVSLQSSNNHLIPADNSVKRKIKRLKKGDHVKITGYLVNVDAENKNGKVYLWNSSTTRGDTGDGACEVIYVTDIIWLD